MAVFVDKPDVVDVVVLLWLCLGPVFHSCDVADIMVWTAQQSVIINNHS